MEHMTHRYITSKELASRLRVTEQTVRRWRMFGYGPRPTPIGRNDRYVRYATVDVESWEKSLTRKKSK
jgi:predicted DNA-binding transcriptional regulator AlpA